MTTRSLFNAKCADRELTLLGGSFAPQGGSAPTTARGAGFTVARQAAGQFRVTLDRRWPELVYASAVFEDTAGRDLRCQIGTVTLGSNIIDIFTSEGQENNSVSFDLRADDGAGAIAEYSVWRVPFALVVTGVNIVPDGTLTAHDTNYATLTLYHRTSAGATQTAIATADTDTGGTDDWAAFAPVPLTIDTAEDDLTAGQSVTFDSATVAAGVDVPLGAIVIDYTTLQAVDIATGRVNFVFAFKNSAAT